MRNNILHFQAFRLRNIDVVPNMFHVDISIFPLFFVSCSQLKSIFDFIILTSTLIRYQQN